MQSAHFRLSTHSLPAPSSLPSLPPPSSTNTPPAPPSSPSFVLTSLRSSSIFVAIISSSSLSSSLPLIIRFGVVRLTWVTIIQLTSFFKAQELCESRSGRHGLPLPSKTDGFAGRKTTLEQTSTSFRQTVCQQDGVREGRCRCHQGQLSSRVRVSPLSSSS